MAAAICLGQWLQARWARRGQPINRAHTHKVTAALVTLMSLEEPGVVYQRAGASVIQDVPVMAGCDLHAVLWQEEAPKTHTTLRTSPLSPT